MLQIRDKMTTPPGGWSYEPEGGPVIEANTFSDLLIEALKYHSAHGLPTHDLAAVVEDNICRRKAVKCAPPKPAPEGGRSIGVADVWRFLVTMKEWLKEGGCVVQEEAERRAEICAGCTQNADISEGCWGCTGILGFVKAAIGDRQTRVDHALKNCRVCACYNIVAVWVPLPVLQKASGELDYPADTGQSKDGVPVPCWRRSEP